MGPQLLENLFKDGKNLVKNGGGLKNPRPGYRTTPGPRETSLSSG